MDDLTQIPGIGKATAKKLAEAGITTFKQLAHDAVAGENGVKTEWIAAAAARLTDAAAETNLPHNPASDGAAIINQPDRLTGEAGDLASLAPAGAQDKTGSTAEAFGPIPDEFRETWPKLSAAIDDWLSVNPDKAPSALRIASRRDGFRRCGVEHPRAATDHEIARFDPAELERFFDEPVLIVELV